MDPAEQDLVSDSLVYRYRLGRRFWYVECLSRMGDLHLTFGLPTQWLRGLDLNQRPLGYELPQPPQITGIYGPPVCRSWHRAAGNATPAQPKIDAL